MYWDIHSFTTGVELRVPAAVKDNKGRFTKKWFLKLRSAASVRLSGAQRCCFGVVNRTEREVTKDITRAVIT